MAILLGPAGSPSKSTLEGIGEVKRLGLQAMEVQFTHGVRMGNELAKQVGKEAEKHGIALSIHAPYYINLLSPEPEKVAASRKRILDSCERMHCLGGGPVVFHPGYYGKLEKEKALQLLEGEVKALVSAVEKNKWDKVIVAPETTGRVSQIGDLSETISLAKAAGCGFCIDFCHLYARGQGKIDYAETLDKLKFARHLHIQFSGVKYGPRGEISHQPLSSGSPPFGPLAKELLKRKLSCRIISESPLTWRDSLEMKKVFERLGHGF